MDNIEDFFKNYRGKYSQYWIERWGLIPELPTSYDNANSVYELVAWLQRAFKNLLDDFQQLESEFEDFKNALIDLLKYLIPELIRRYSDSAEFRTIFISLLDDILAGEERNWLKDLLKELLEVDMRKWIETYLKELYGLELNKTNAQLAEIRQYNPKDYGAVGDGITDDTQAFKNMVDVLNATGKKTKVQLTKGTYVLNEGLHFQNEVEIVGDNNVWIDYQGSGTMFKLGKDDITVDEFHNYKRFEIKNVGFKGGANMTYGIYTNKLVTQPRILNCNFENFGNPNACGIYFDDDAWDGLVQGCRWDSDPDGVARNFIGMYGRGNSRIRVFDNLVTSLTGVGTAIYLNGFNCIVSRNKIEGFAVNVRLGGMCSGAIVRDNYFEKAGTKTGCIEIGSIPGDNGDTTTPVGILIDNNYCNVRVRAENPETYFIKPTKSTDLIKDMKVTNNYINAWNNGNIWTEIVNQNNLAGQTGNIAENNFTLMIDKINTIGSGITHWGGTQSPRRVYKPLADIDRYDDYYMGNSKNNVMGRRVRRFDGGVQFQEEIDANGNVTYHNDGKLVMRFLPNGRVSIGQISNNAVFDVSGDIMGSHMRVSQQRTPATVQNGSIFEDSDGKLKYKNLSGTVTDLTL